MLENREGQAVPAVTFKSHQHNEWVDVNSDEIFSNKRVELFAWRLYTHLLVQSFTSQLKKG